GLAIERMRPRATGLLAKRTAAAPFAPSAVKRPRPRSSARSSERRTLRPIQLIGQASLSKSGTDHGFPGSEKRGLSLVCRSCAERLVERALRGGAHEILAVGRVG